jgi:hypothetical protein
MKKRAAYRSKKVRQAERLERIKKDMNVKEPEPLKTAAKKN